MKKTALCSVLLIFHFILLYHPQSNNNNDLDYYNKKNKYINGYILICNYVF